MPDPHEAAKRELFRRYRKERAAKESLSDRAAGCLYCICHGFANVEFVDLGKRREKDCYWSIGCATCWVPGGFHVQAQTHAEAVAAWNKKQERVKLT